MNYYYMNFSSITTASRVRKYFEMDKDYIAIMRTPHEIARGGCGYSLKFRADKLDDIIQVVNAYNIKIKGIYLLNSQNKFEEVPYDLRG